MVSNYGDGFAYDRADLINPVLIDADGNETSLLTLTAASYTSEWGTMHVNRNVENGPLRVDGTTYTTGLGLNAQCTLVYDLPAGHNYKPFRALCGYDSSCDTDNTSTSGTTMEFIVYVTKNEVFSFDLTQLGYSATESVPVHDIWSKTDLAPATGVISASVPSHGVRLFRLGDKKANAIQSLHATQTNNAEAVRRGYQSHVYDLGGRIIGTVGSADASAKGPFIVNGKKVVQQ